MTCFQPEGRTKIAQRFIAGVAKRYGTSPGGTRERKVEAGWEQGRALPSLRDSHHCGPGPSDESLGYSRPSLRDFLRRIERPLFFGGKWRMAIYSTQIAEFRCDQHVGFSLWIAVQSYCRPAGSRFENAGCRRQAKPLECGDSSPLLAGDLSPSNLLRRTIQDRTAGCWRLLVALRASLLGRQGGQAEKRRPVAALQNALGVTTTCPSGDFVSTLRTEPLDGHDGRGANPVSAPACKGNETLHNRLMRLKLLLSEP